MLSVPKLIVSVLLVRLTALLVELVTLVVPVTAKLPEVALRLMPFVALLSVTLDSDMASGVVPLLLLMLTALPLPVLIVPLVVVMAPLFSVAFNPAWLEVVFVILSAAK